VTADLQAERAIATLQRRMLALRDRIVDLGHYTTHHGDHKHAVLSYELNTVTMLAELADEWCFDLMGPTIAVPTKVERAAHVCCQSRRDGEPLCTRHDGHPKTSAPVVTEPQGHVSKHGYNHGYKQAVSSMASTW